MLKKFKYLCLTICITILISSCIILSKKISRNDVLYAVPSMVYVHSARYVEDGISFSDIQPEFVYIGKISSTTNDEFTKPSKELQTNSGDDFIGSKIYQYKKRVVIFYGGRYWTYQRCSE